MVTEKYLPFNRTILECKLAKELQELEGVEPLIELYQNVNPRKRRDAQPATAGPLIELYQNVNKVTLYIRY